MNAFKAYYKAYVKVVFQHRVGLLLSVVIDPIVVLVTISLFTSIYTHQGAHSIAGYELTQMIWYFAGINFVWYLTFTFTDIFLSEGILTGDLSLYLIRPCSVMNMLLANSAAIRTLGACFEFFPNFIVYSLLCPPTFMSVGSFFRFLSCILLSFFLTFFINFLVGLSAFIFKNNLSLRHLKTILIGLLGGGFFPLDFYPPWLARILDFLPFKYVFFMPLQFLLNKEGTRSLLEYGQAIGIQLAWIMTLFLLCRILWHKAIKHFCGVGG